MDPVILKGLGFEQVKIVHSLKFGNRNLKFFLHTPFLAKLKPCPFGRLKYRDLDGNKSKLSVDSLFIEPTLVFLGIDPMLPTSAGKVVIAACIGLGAHVKIIVGIGLQNGFYG